MRNRSTFAALSRSGRRVGSGTVWARYLPDSPGAPPQVAFAIGRQIGGAVSRNRLRRRLRAILRELAVEDQIPPGAYLIGVRPGAGAASYEDLRASMIEVVRQVVKAEDGS